MRETTPTEPVHLGFLTVFQEGTCHLGGYLITNAWGRPLEFRLSTAVQPNRVQQILYGPTLNEYVCADVIGRTLVEKSSTPIHLLLTDSLKVLPVRARLDVPVATVTSLDESPANEHLARIPHASLSLWFDSRRAADAERIEQLLKRIDPALDLGEPFGRIREAMGEARKMGVTSRAA